jgi:hypothetical protein
MTESAGFPPDPEAPQLGLTGAEPVLSLAERIDRALQDSVDRCARCKACDVQVDAVLGVLREVLAEKDDEIARLTAEGAEHRRTIRTVSDLADASLSAMQSWDDES